jgi:NADPH2:quinone reductase
MKAFQVQSFEQPPELVDVALPQPASGEVLLKISACGLNFADLLMQKGKYQDTPQPPFTLGMEVCGTVAALGEGVTGLSQGDRVVVFGGQGGLAEYGVFPAERCRPVPDSMADAEAAGFMVAYGTSHLALTRRARLQEGETLLVLGAAGGVGLTAVEVGKQLGATVIAVARGQEKLAIARQAGADHLIDAGADLVTELRALGGVDVVYDAVGGQGFMDALRACKREARMLAIGFASGDVPQVPANHLLVKNVDVLGFYWGGYLKFNPAALGDSLAELMDWYDRGWITPHISHTVPLAEADQALQLLADRKSTGKVVVTM